MIGKLRRRFVCLAVAALFALLALLVAGMNIVNYRTVCKDADGVLTLLSHNRGDFPMLPSMPEPPMHSPELAYESRYFSVLLDAEGTILQIDTRRIAAVSEQSAAQYAELAAQKRAERGFFGIYRYLRSAEGENTRIVFLDCGRRLDDFYGFLTGSVLISLGAFALVSVLFLFLSARLLHPIAESYEKQRRFITDAGHELKTPLTIIRANADLLEMEQGENESLDEIRRQAQRLTALTNDLVLLSRMQEPAPSERIDFPLSEVVSETAASFRAPAVSRGQTLESRIAPLLTLCGDSAAIAKLVGLLLDNALKYSPEGACITLTLAREGKTIALTVENPTAQPLTEEAMAHLLDRFYRADPSRNTATGGYGIGLSVADAIVSAHGGKLLLSRPAPCRFRISAVFPS